ncbi:MAG: hypothetical protein M3N56_16370 [Actinomycetota bacterium]|nr:hypothetical protein [Actinomycetota bacterium]
MANYADRAEHNEAIDRRWVLDSAEELQAVAGEIAAAEGLDLLELYAERLAAIETQSALDGEQAPGARAIRDARTWRDLQLAQAKHDQLFHPDVVGLMKSQQLQHYALHLIKITGALARRCESESPSQEVLSRRLPDLLLFSVKLHTVMNSRMAAAALPLRAQAPRLAAI